ncbi:hypothetical protein C1645_861334 [Glomus cerebriforme]|uniref:Uncharacterized protein n=1 Tax=Glomus cerebriforme TaxID=658196 RepID=A0A397SCA3_9GLOM|nr:hypothetical protein C1645_861334 [Glomus cerebriforme]
MSWLLKNSKNDEFNDLKEYVTVEDDYIYIHLDVDSSFTNVTYHFATNELASRLIDEYERKTSNNICNFIVCGHDFPETASFRGYFFKDYSHKKLYKDSSFKVQYLKENDNIVITEKNIIERKNNFYAILEDIREDCYNRPKSKSNISVDSFVYEDDNALDLYQITILTNHGIKHIPKMIWYCSAAQWAEQSFLIIF